MQLVLSPGCGRTSPPILLPGHQPYLSCPAHIPYIYDPPLHTHPPVAAVTPSGCPASGFETPMASRKTGRRVRRSAPCDGPSGCQRLAPALLLPATEGLRWGGGDRERAKIEAASPDILPRHAGFKIFALPNGTVLWQAGDAAPAPLALSIALPPCRLGNLS